MRLSNCFQTLYEESNGRRIIAVIMSTLNCYLRFVPPVIEKKKCPTLLTVSFYVNLINFSDL